MLSEKESPVKKTAVTSISLGGENSSNTNFRNGFIQPRTQKAKNVIKEQEKKLKYLDDQNKRTHKMIKQFNSRDDNYLNSADPVRE